jgi:hypothetical protein
MKLPIVARAKYDALDANFQRSISLLRDWEGRFDRLLRQHNDLIAQMTALAPASATRGQSALTTAIRDLSRQADGSIDQRLVNHFRQRANELERDGMAVDDVISTISVWDDSETTSRMTADAIATMAEAEDRR